eukprot:Rhum_TRINITY_DN17137_c0_g1::Rhum_TRINITY_DN17137_c0_g1_i1::g.165253::m.165253
MGKKSGRGATDSNEWRGHLTAMWRVMDAASTRGSGLPIPRSCPATGAEWEALRPVVCEYYTAISRKWGNHETAKILRDSLSPLDAWAGVQGRERERVCASAHEERRTADDGVAYTKAEFDAHYGNDSEVMWEKAAGGGRSRGNPSVADDEWVGGGGGDRARKAPIVADDDWVGGSGRTAEAAASAPSRKAASESKAPPPARRPVLCTGWVGGPSEKVMRQPDGSSPQATAAKKAVAKKKKEEVKASEDDDAWW